MGILEVLLTALGLSMDATAVSVSNAMCYPGQAEKRFFASLSFGLFQGIMPLIGYFCAMTFASHVQRLDHWVAFVGLGLIGAKMVWEGVKAMHDPESCPAGGKLSFQMILTQSVATSVDALMVGLSFAFLQVNIWFSAVFIAGVTFLCSLLGSVLGSRLGSLLREKAQIAGGLILMLIGAKILAEHLSEGI